MAKTHSDLKGLLTFISITFMVIALLTLVLRGSFYLLRKLSSIISKRKYGKVWIESTEEYQETSDMSSIEDSAVSRVNYLTNIEIIVKRKGYKDRRCSVINADDDKFKKILSGISKVVEDLNGTKASYIG